MDRMGNTAYILAASLLLSCANLRSEPEQTVYRFKYGDSDCQIVGSRAPGGERVNLLVGRENDQVVFRALDRDQNGMIDEVLQGDVSVEEANAIYAEGIAHSIRRGKYRERRVPMVYEVIDRGRIYIIRTHPEGDDSFRNTFTMYDRATGGEEAFEDADADGVLDAAGEGQEEWQRNQELYVRVLEAGVRDGRIAKVCGRYIVR